ncbi:hypothetical protein J5N97_009538 [Dioscorea zingiberensis]|uniref:Gnk2-homologous domain-containing protein n=1 Tax=Dioscorea zingiberensis TaxID=325984 RepID=A0A9D5CXQ9_9LILI|nr:hypothetical protein J5N97_009538 [Dioscorea zingiberensis]
MASSSYYHHHLYSYYYYYLFLSLLLSSSSSSADDPTSFIYAGCSQSKFSPGSPFQLNLDSLLSSLSSSSSLSSFSNLTSLSSSSSSSPAFGLFQCLPDLPLPSCSSCIHSALSQLSVLCSSATSAALRLHSCLLRYSNTSFFSHPDTTLLLKTCGPPLTPATFSTDITAMRDTVLSQLLQSPALTSTYRTAASGYFQADSQCDGDLSTKACDDCMAAAAAQLRAACSDALSGDVYLGRCFARFWSNGVYSHKPSTGDEAGKTFAIIIGLLAGVALLIVFLSFIRRAASGAK